MNKDERYTFEILTRIEQNSRVTQPEIAKQLGISIGLTNSFIKRIAKKGYIKLTTIPCDRAKYLLTAQGIAEKSRLAFKYLLYSLNFYKRAKDTISRAYDQLHREGAKSIVLYGTGEVAEIAYILLQQNRMRLAGVVDEVHAGKRFMRQKTVGLEDLTKLSFDKIIITSIQPAEGIGIKISAAGIPAEKMLFLDELTAAPVKEVSHSTGMPALKEPV